MFLASYHWYLDDPGWPEPWNMSKKPSVPFGPHPVTSKSKKRIGSGHYKADNIELLNETNADKVLWTYNQMHNMLTTNIVVHRAEMDYEDLSKVQSKISGFVIAWNIFSQMLGTEPPRPHPFKSTTLKCAHHVRHVNQLCTLQSEGNLKHPWGDPAIDRWWYSLRTSMAPASVTSRWYVSWAISRSDSLTFDVNYHIDVR